MVVRDSKFRPSRPSDLLFRLYPGAIRGAGLLYLWYTTFRTDVARQEYYRREHSRSPLFHLRELFSAARVDECLGGDAAIR